MTEIKRYKIEDNFLDLGVKGGLFVREKDYAALQEQVRALAAENAALKKFCKDAAFDADYSAVLNMEHGGFSDGLNNIKTLATDTYLDSIRAEGLKMAIDHMNNQTSDNCADVTILPVMEMHKKLSAGEQP